MRAVVRGVASLFFIAGTFAFLVFSYRSFSLWRDSETGPLDLQPAITAALLSAVVVLLAAIAGILCLLEEAIEAALQDRSKIVLMTSGRVSLDGAA